VVLAAALPGVNPAAGTLADDPPILEYSSTGSGPAADEFNRLMPHRAVQALLLDIARAPRDRAYVDAALRGTDTTVERLAAVGLIRQADSVYRLAFSLLTAEDRAVIRAAAEREGRLLAGHVLAHRQTIEELITDAKLPAGDWKAAAFFLVGCVSLDWDGLNLVEERKYLATGGRGEFIPSAWQPVPPEDVRRLYWGSHNYHDTLAVTTFGDHADLPRVGLPDLFWGMTLAAPDAIQARARRAAEGLVRREATRVMLALRDGPKDLARLAAAAGVEQQPLKDMLALLASLDYVAESAGRYEARITVLDERDRGMVRQLRQLGRQVMQRWADERYATLASELDALTPRRYGVPLSHSFYWVWHYIFGIANRELVAAGLFADPYDPGRRFQGFLPSVYKLNVVQGRF
jgi:nucleotidyltransferase/DNA polymerase involved in DNA repair